MPNNKDLPLYELVIDENTKSDGVFAISIVDNPAIESNFQMFSSKKPIKFETVSKDQQIIMGPAMIPDMKIIREDDRGLYNVFFSKDTVRAIAHKFMKESRNGSATVMHAENVEGVSVIESWIVEDAQKDKSRYHGFTVPVGTWMVSQKISNQTLWEDFIKSGELRGFSVEGFFDELSEFRKSKQSTELDKMDELKELFNSSK